MFVVVVAFPIGIGAAVYLEEYAAEDAVHPNFINVNIRNLAGVPSVVYGILGLAIFVEVAASGVHRRRAPSISAGITLAVLVLPIVIITSAEAIRAVPQQPPEAGFGVGATRWEVDPHHVLPYAAPGILTGTVLALARALGEAAPLHPRRRRRRAGWPTTTSSSTLEQLREPFTAMPIVITDWARRAADPASAS